MLKYFWYKTHYFLQSDAHYSVLCVLLLLSGVPTAEDYEEKPEVEGKGNGKHAQM